VGERAVGWFVGCVLVCRFGRRPGGLRSGSLTSGACAATAADALADAGLVLADEVERDGAGVQVHGDSS